jgi:hypothetical protein
MGFINFDSKEAEWENISHIVLHPSENRSIIHIFHSIRRKILDFMTASSVWTVPLMWAHAAVSNPSIKNPPCQTLHREGDRSQGPSTNPLSRGKCLPES